MKRIIYMLIFLIIVIDVTFLSAQDAEQALRKVIVADNMTISTQNDDGIIELSIHQNGDKMQLPITRENKYNKEHLPIAVFDNHLYYMRTLILRGEHRNTHLEKMALAKFSAVNEKAKSSTNPFALFQANSIEVCGITPIRHAINYAEYNEAGFKEGNQDRPYPVYYDFVVLDTDHIRVFVLSRSPNPRKYEDIELSVWEYEDKNWQAKQTHKVEFLELFKACRVQNRDYLVLANGDIVQVGEQIDTVGQLPIGIEAKQLIVDTVTDQLFVTDAQDISTRSIENAVKILPLE